MAVFYQAPDALSGQPAGVWGRTRCSPRSRLLQGFKFETSVSLPLAGSCGCVRDSVSFIVARGFLPSAQAGLIPALLRLL